MARPDRDEGLLALVREAFENSGRRYGYRRVWLELRGAGIVVSAKRVMRLMTRHGLVPPAQTGAPLQLVQGRDRRRGAREPREPGLPRRGAEPPVGHGHHRVPHPRGQGVPVAGDRLHDGMRWPGRSAPGRTPSWPTGCCARRAPRSGDGERPVIHSDRGCHYRWPGWIGICEEHGLTRSMSAKGCSPDNAAAEGFFGRLKQEFFHERTSRA